MATFYPANVVFTKWRGKSIRINNSIESVEEEEAGKRDALVRAAGSLVSSLFQFRESEFRKLFPPLEFGQEK